MRKFLFFLILQSTFIIHHSFSQSPNWLWAKSIGETGNEYGSSVAVDVSGSVYTTGSFQGTVDFDPGVGTFNLTSAGGYDIFILKLDGSGNFVWAKQIGGSDDDGAGSIALDPASGDVYTTGGFSQTVDFDPGTGTFNLTSAGGMDIFISKLDGSGNFVLAKAMGGTDDEFGVSIALDTSGSGGIYTTGIFSGTADFDPDVGTQNLTSAGQLDIFISKLNSSGNFVWAKAMGGTYDDYSRSIAIETAGSGDVYTTGNFEAIADFDPGAGTFNLISPGQFDIFISKLDSAGNFVWAKGIGSTDKESGWSIALDPAGSGDIFTTGFFQGTADFDPGVGTFYLSPTGGADIFILKLNSSGNFVWAKQISYGEGWFIALDPAGSGDVYTTGYFDGTADFDPGVGTFNLTSVAYEDIFVCKLDNSGNFVWAKAMGGTGFDYGRSIALDVSGNMHVAGEFQSPTVTFGSTTLTNAGGGNYDAFVAKLDHVTGIESLEYKNGISVFPNPSSGEFTIDINEMQNQMQRDISIYNVLGEKAYSTIITSQSSTINLDVPNGIYFLHIKTENNSITQKLIIQK